MNRAKITYMNGDVTQVVFGDSAMTEGACIFSNEHGETLIAPLCNIKHIKVDAEVDNESTP